MTENLQDTASLEAGKQDPTIVDNSKEIVNPADITPEAKPNDKQDDKQMEQLKEGDKPEAKKEEVKEYPDDWREKIAKDDEKVLKKLQRLKTPEDLAKSYLELEKKLSETRAKFQLPENPTPDDVKKFRGENGIPEKPEDYDLKLDGGLVIGEFDKPIVDEFTKIVHEKHLPNDTLKTVLQSYLEAKTKAEAETTKFLQDTQQKADAEIQEQWGDKIDENKTKIRTFLENKFGQDEALLLDQAILPDGSSLATNPKLLNKFLNLANAFYETPSDTSSNVKVSEVNAELAELKQMIKDGTYYSNPANPKRMAELLEAKQKLGI